MELIAGLLWPTATPPQTASMPSHNGQISALGRGITAAQRKIRVIIFGWDVTSVKARLVNRHGFTPEAADELEGEYKRFLVLVAESGQRLPVSRPVDTFWHEHVLFTNDYRNLCDAVGVQLHHWPTRDEEETQDLVPLYDGTLLPLYAATFGEPNQAFWPKSMPLCCCGSGAGH